MKKFRAYWGDKIEELEVLKETDKTIWFINGSGHHDSERIYSGNHSWHETKEKAIEYLVFQQDIKIKQYEKYIEHCNKAIEKIKAL